MPVSRRIKGGSVQTVFDLSHFSRRRDMQMMGFLTPALDHEYDLAMRLQA